MPSETEGRRPPSGERGGEAGFEHFEHDADIGVRGFGPTLEKAFEGAALGLAAIVAEPETIARTGRVEIACEAPSVELLFVEWLNALVYESAVRGMLFARFSIEIEDGRLRGEAWGEPADRARHEPAVEVKGATLTALMVEREASGRWIAQCIVDV